MSLPWRVEMLGGLRVVQADRTITRFQTQKTASLLAYLALNLGGSHSREVLSELLWPGGDPSVVRNRLNQAGSSLRRQLEPPPIVHGSVLITDPRTVRLNPAAIETDVQEFLRRLHQAEKADSSDQKKLHLSRAIELYAGEFLEGFYFEWVTREQLRFSNLYSGALFDLLDICRESGDVEQAIKVAVLLLKADPYDEGAHCDLMRLYLDAGRPMAAKRQFDELTRILAADEETPSDEALELNQEACSSRAKASKPVRMTPAEQAAYKPDEREDASFLPSMQNRFVGRESDRAKLKAMLSEQFPRVVTILGLGGCGKTRLALQVAGDLAESFGQKAYFVPLADIHDVRQIEEAIASSCGIRGAENIVRRLRQNERTLLVLDNLEHLVEAAAEVVSSLLETVPTLKCLATSRRPLRIDAEQCYSLSPLPVPNESEEIGELGKNPSIALFVDRAQAVLPDFQITSRNAGVLRQVCQKLEGLPLAIELAASWAKTVAPTQMLGMLADRFALLESRRRDISARHRTMRAVIDSGMSLLSQENQTLFYRLGIFHGGWTLEASAEICQWPGVLFGMETLAEHSLIFSEGSDKDVLRFRMLDTLRDYALEHLPSANAAEMANLHAEYYSRLAAEGEHEPWCNNQALWCDRVEAEYANISAAFRWYVDHGLIESALRLANSLASFWEFKGRTREGRNWIETCFGRIGEDSEVEPRTKALAVTNLTRMIWVRGDFAEATRWHDQMLSAWFEIGDVRGIIDAQFNVLMEAHRTRDYDRAVALLQDSLSKAIEIGDLFRQSRSWLALGNTSIEMHMFDEAREQYEQALKIARLIDNKHRTATALNNLGNLAVLRGQWVLARRYLLEALELLDQIGAKPYSVDALLHLAKLERHENRVDDALGWLEKVWRQNPEATYYVQALFLEQAFAAAARGLYVPSATFLGFVDRQREEYGALNQDIELDEYDVLVAKVKSSLSNEAFQEAWMVGRSLEIAQVGARMLRPPLERTG